MAVEWIELTKLRADADLDGLVLTLNRHGIEHRITREQEDIYLLIADASKTDQALEIIDQVQRVININKQQAANAPSARILADAYLRRLPVTIATLVFCILGAALVKFFPDLLSVFTFQKFTIINNVDIEFEPLSEALARNEWWRILTPAFLHFGIFHVVFNSLWLWEFGRRIELLVGSGAYLLLLSAMAVGANVGQYLWSGPSLFGGLSGVVYGLLGYIWIRGKRAPHPLLELPGAILPIMLVWLLVCLFGVVDLLIQGGVANGAHVSGLLIGMVFGAVAGRKTT